MSTVVRFYEAVLGIREAAAEAGLTHDAIAKRIGARPELTRVLGPLLAPGGTVQRQVYESAYSDLMRALPSATAPVRRQLHGTSGFLGRVGLRAGRSLGRLGR